MPLANIQGKFIVKAGGGGLTAPGTPSISSVTGSGFTVSWTAVAGAIGYRLDISTSSSFNSFVAGYNSKAVSGTSEVVTGLSSETTYYVRLRTVGVSANSGSVSGTTEVQTSTLTEGLLAFYKLSDLTDSSGNGNTLTNNGGVTFSTGKIGNAATYSGSNNLKSSLVVPYTTSDVTLSLWLKAAATNQWRTFFGSTFSNSSRINFGINGSDEIFINDFHDGPILTLSNYTVDDTWQHIVAVITNSGDSVAFYRAGNFVVQHTGADLGSTSVWIGGGTGYPTEADSFNGQIDAVGIWNRALTESEITELYNSGNGLEIN